MIKRPKPIVEQVFSELQERIADGYYAPQTRIPSESELAEEFGVSRATIRTALATLAAAGRVTRRQGDGTYVNEFDPGVRPLIGVVWEFFELITSQGKTPGIKGLEMLRRFPSAEEIRSLELDASDEVVCITRIFYADEVPVILSVNVSPAAIFKKPLEDLDFSLGLIRFIKEYTDVELESAYSEISAALADLSNCRQLGLEVGAPLLRMREVFYADKKMPVVCTMNYISGLYLPFQVVRRWL